jgi:hypothetical protein
MNVETHAGQLGRSASREVAQTLFGAVLDESLLSPAVCAFHCRGGSVIGEGTFDVVRGSNPLSWAIGRLLGLPASGRAIPTRITIRRTGLRETWERTFGGQPFRSDLWLDSTGVVERFGPTTTHLTLSVTYGGIRFTSTRTTVTVGAAMVRLPRALAPDVVGSVVSEGDGARLKVSVLIRAPFAGTVLSYSGFVHQRGGERTCP